MVRLEELAPGAQVKGILPESPVAVTGVRWHGGAGVELDFADGQGHKGQILLCREHEGVLEIVGAQHEWSFEADSRLWRLVAAAQSLAVGGEVHRGTMYLYGMQLLAYLGKSNDEDLVAAGETMIADLRSFVPSQTDPSADDLILFFETALAVLGGRSTPLREGRYEVTTLPEGVGNSLELPKIIDFNPSDEPDVEFVDSGHQMVRALARQVLAEYGSLLRRGSVLVAPGAGTLRVCLLVEQAIGKAEVDAEDCCRELQWVEVDAEGQSRACPDSSAWTWRLPSADEQERIDVLCNEYRPAASFEDLALEFAVAETVPLHLEAARRDREYIARLIAEKVADMADAHSTTNGNGRSIAVGLGERLSPILEAWLEAPLLPRLPAVVGGVLLIPEAYLGSDETARSESEVVGGLAVELADRAAEVAGAKRDLSTDLAEEKPRDEGFFAQIPGLITPSEERRSPQASPLSAATHRPPMLTQSKVQRVPVDLQREWQAHAERLAGLGVEVPAGVELVQRNPIDGGISVWIPPGIFAMGDRRGDRDEKPMHQVYLDGYYIDLLPVTQGQYLHFVRESGYRARKWEPQDGAGDHPVVDVNWEDAVAYCSWAQKRLPTEAEWEKAARGTCGYQFPWGEDFEPGRASVLGRGFSGTSPVGNMPGGASPYGVLDLAGNVWEWVADYYDPDYYTWSPSHNPLGPDNGQQRVMRGGAWICHRRYLRCANREHQNSEYSSRLVGFRCAL